MLLLHVPILLIIDTASIAINVTVQTLLGTVQAESATVQTLLGTVQSQSATLQTLTDRVESKPNQVKWRCVHALVHSCKRTRIFRKNNS